MAIKWWNIRSKEIRISETEPHTAAMWASSDHSPNITQGQDFGWRLAPEVVVEMKKIKQDLPTLTEIARQIMKQTDEITEPDILMYISAKYDDSNAPQADDGDYTDEYDAEIRRLQAQADRDNNPLPVTETTTESLADLQKRVELQERLAAAKKVEEAPVTTTTTETPTTTTTTVKQANTGRTTTTTTEAK
jgi:hypothetical protein